MYDITHIHICVYISKPEKIKQTRETLLIPSISDKGHPTCTWRCQSRSRSVDVSGETQACLQPLYIYSVLKDGEKESLVCLTFHNHLPMKFIKPFKTSPSKKIYAIVFLYSQHERFLTHKSLFNKKFNMKMYMTQLLHHSKTGPLEREHGFLC